MSVQEIIVPMQAPLFLNCTNESNDYKKMIQCLSATSQNFLKIRLNQTDPIYSTKFLRYWKKKKWKKLLPPKTKQQLHMIRGALLALKMGELSINDYCSYSMAYSSHKELLKHAKKEDCDIYFNNKKKDFIYLVNSPKFPDVIGVKACQLHQDSYEIKTYFSFSDIEWDSFIRVMKKSEDVAKQYLLFPQISIDSNTIKIDELRRKTGIGILHKKQLFNQDIQKEVIIPSFDMIKNFYYIKQRVFGRKDSVRLTPILGLYHLKQRQVFQDKGEVPICFSHPDVDNLPGNTHSADTTTNWYTGAMYDAYRELLTSPNWCKIRNRWVSLIENSNRKEFYNFAKKLTMGEGPAMYANPRLGFQENWFSMIDDKQLRNFLILDMIWNAEEYQSLYYVNFTEITQIGNDISKIAKREFPKLNNHKSPQAKFSVALILSQGTITLKKNYSRALKLFLKVGKSMDSGAAYYFAGIISFNIGLPFEQHFITAGKLNYKPVYDITWKINNFFFKSSLKNISSHVAKAKETFLHHFTKPNFIKEIGFDSIPELIEEYFPYLLMSANQLDPQSSLLVAECFLKINDIRNESEAFKYCLQASQTGHPISQRFLGDFYRLGIGTKRCFESAEKQYRRAFNEWKEGEKNDQPPVQLDYFYPDKKQEEQVLLEQLLSFIDDSNAKIPHSMAIYPKPVFIND